MPSEICTFVMGIKNKSTSKYIQIILTQKFDQVTIRSITINFDAKIGQFALFLAVKYLFSFNEITLHFQEIAITHPPTQ